MINQIKPFKLPIKVEVFIRTSDETRKYLLLKRSIVDGGFWQPITGTLESQDNITECILREIKEETSILPEEESVLSDVVHRFTWKKEDVTISEYVFVLTLKNESSVVLSEEHTDYQWVTYEDAIRILTKQNNIDALNIVNQI